MWTHFLSSAFAQKVLFGIFIRSLQLTTFKKQYMLNSAKRPNLTGYPYTYVLILPQIYHLNFPRSAPIWSCSSDGRATVICSGGRGFESHRGQRFFSFSLWDHFLSRAFAQKELFGTIIRAQQLITDI